MGLSHGWKAVEGGVSRCHLLTFQSAIPGEMRALHSHGPWTGTPAALRMEKTDSALTMCFRATVEPQALQRSSDVRDAQSFKHVTTSSSRLPRHTGECSRTQLSLGREWEMQGGLDQSLLMALGSVWFSLLVKQAYC